MGVPAGLLALRGFPSSIVGHGEMRKERLEKCRSEIRDKILLHSPLSQSSLFSSLHLPAQVRKTGSKQHP